MRRVSSCTIDRTACASARATSAASPDTRTLNAPPSSMRSVSQQSVQLVLESARLDRAVDPALLGRVRLPPPASGTARLVGRDRAGARVAADRAVAAVVELVIGHLAL